MNHGTEVIYIILDSFFWVDKNLGPFYLAKISLSLTQGQRGMTQGPSGQPFYLLT